MITGSMGTTMDGPSLNKPDQSPQIGAIQMEVGLLQDKVALMLVLKGERHVIALDEIGVLQAIQSLSLALTTLLKKRAGIT